MALRKKDTRFLSRRERDCRSEHMASNRHCSGPPKSSRIPRGYPLSNWLHGNGIGVTIRCGSGSRSMGVHVVVAEFTQHAADPHLRLMDRRLRAGEAGGIMAAGYNSDLGGLPSVQRQTCLESPIFSFVVPTASIDRHRGWWSVGCMPPQQNISAGLCSVVFQPEPAGVKPHMDVAIVGRSCQASVRAYRRGIGPLQSLIESAQACDKCLKCAIAVSKIAVMFNDQGWLSHEEVKSKLLEVVGIAAAEQRALRKPGDR